MNTVEQFYEELLAQNNVPWSEMNAAREKRDELRKSIVELARRRVGAARAFPSGALAAGTQIQPLNDVDTVLELVSVLEVWRTEPRRAMEDFVLWLGDEIEGRFEISTHAIKITYGDEEFTADVVIAQRAQVGIFLPECPDNGPHRWITSHPERHVELVRERNERWGSARFSREIRILKYLNREWKLRDPLERKPLSSHHLSALALAILSQTDTYCELTPLFLEQAAVMVRHPLPDPSGIGQALEARDPEYAALLLADAGQKTLAALSASPEGAERLLLDVFGRPSERLGLIGKGPVSVASGSLIGGVQGQRRVRTVRSDGDRD